MTAQSSSVFWRGLALVLVGINSLHGLLLERLHPSLPSIADVSAKNESLFTPAGYAFSIWGLIYAAFMAFCVWVLLPNQRRQPAYDPLAKGIAAYALLGMIWEETFIREHIGVSVVIIIGMFIVGAVLFGLAKKLLGAGVGRALCYAPFSLFFGWISVATLANFASWLKSHGWQGGSWGEESWTALFITAAVLLGMLVSTRWKDSTYPLVIIWSLLAIWARHRDGSGILGQVALVGAIALGIWTVINANWIRTLSVRRRERPSAPV